MSVNIPSELPSFDSDSLTDEKLDFDQFEYNGEQLVFGDFEDKEYEQYFVDTNNVVGVEFLFSSQEALLTSGEGGRKSESVSDVTDEPIPPTEKLASVSIQNSDNDSSKESNIVVGDICVNGEISSDTYLANNASSSDESTVTNNPQTTCESSPSEVVVSEPETKSSSTNTTLETSALDSCSETQNDPKPVKPSSWASLFKSTESPQATDLNGKKPVIVSVNIESVPKSVPNELDASLDVTVIPLANDDRAVRLAEFISKQPPKYNRHHLQLRGLVNRCNWCYINSTLQALLGIPPITHFYKMLKSFHEPLRKSTSTPLTDSMIAFFSEFEPINPRIPLKKQTDDLRGGEAFEPKCVYEMLPAMKTTLSEKGRQQDAEEFLSFLLNGIHEELVSLLKLAQSPTPTTTEQHTHMNGSVGENERNTNNNDNDNEDSWECVGPRNRSAMVRAATINDSLIKHVFGGVIRSSVHQSGVKESATLQPFFTLQLDIQNEKVWNLKEAIEYYFMKENLQGFTCSKTNAEVEASRRSTLEELPHIFIFHLKYFVYDRTGGCQKIHKAIDIPVDLEIPKDILSPGLKSRTLPNTRNYKLFAVVYHHGKNAAGGHYTACVHHGNPFGWVRFDDNLIKPVPVTQVLKHQQGRVPYLLFYERTQSP